jgi:hypothetical protein
MLLICAAIGSVGFLLGFWLRPPALVVASAVIAVVYLSVAPSTAQGPASVVAMNFALLSVLQIAYLAGLLRRG